MNEATPQLTDEDIQEMLDRNNLEITYNSETQKYELYGKLREKKFKMRTCQFKTVLIVSVRTIDRNRKRLKELKQKN